MRIQKSFLRLLGAIFIALVFLLPSFSQEKLPDEVVLSYLCKNKPLKAVLKDLDQKSNVRISFVERRIPSNSKVTISAVNQTLGTILTSILKPRKCMYEIIGNQIVVTRINARNLERYLTISGYIRDKLSGEELVASNIFLFDKSKGTQSNEYGFYSITLPRGVKRMYFSYLGYGQEVKEFFLQKDTIIDVYLEPDVQLNEVIILDDVENKEEPSTISQSRLNLDKIRTSSSLGGEADVIRLVGMMPGVSSGADGLGGVNVRGGSADQNLVLLDGVPVYNSGHAIGIFSIFNANVIKNATLIKGNIPARYGGRLSSVLDVRTRDGNKNRFGGDVTLSALAVKASLEGPIGKNGSSYIFSGRRTYLDPWIKSLTKYQNEVAGDEGFSTYHFLDLNGKLSLKLNKKNRLYISGFFGRDKYYNEKQSSEIKDEIFNEIDRGVDWDWGNTLFSGKLTTQFSNKTFGRLTGYYTKFLFDSFEFDSFKTEDSTESRRIYKAGFFTSGINDIGVKYDLDYIPNPRHTIRSGIGAIRHEFSPGLVSVNNSDNVFDINEDISRTKVEVKIDDTQLLGYEFYSFVEDDISLNEATVLNLGLHANYILGDDNSYLNLQPRISLLAKWDNAFFKTGISRMSQYLHLLSSNGLGLPTDVWLPSTDILAPEQSWIFVLGGGYFTDSGIRAGIEGYYKIFDNLTTFNEGGIEPISASSDWEALLPVGSGTAYGAEFYFNKIIGRTTWNFNYALSFSNREFPRLNQDGDPFPFRYNRRHSLKLGGVHKITDNTEFVLNYILSSGNPITEPTGDVVLEDGSIQVIYDRKNNGLLPNYHRLDIGFNFYSKYEWGRTKFTIGLYNAFNRNNPFYIDIENSAENPNRFQQVEYSILPIIPSLGYSVSF